MNAAPPAFRALALWVAAVICALLSLIVWQSRQQPTRHAVITTKATPKTTAPPTQQVEIPSFPSFQVRPFTVAKESPTHQWTAEDGRSPEHLLKLSHNEFERARMEEENDRIQRRQLIYRKQPAWQLVEQAKAKGEPLRQLSLPDFDGIEHLVEITRADLAPSGLSGSFTGRLPGRAQSLVTLAYQRDKEAFTILSPEDGTYLQGHPREGGQIILTRFDPETYLPKPGGEPIRTAQPPLKP